MSNDAKKRIIIPGKRPQIDESNISYDSNSESLLNDAMCVIASELAKFRSMTTRGLSLDLKQSRVLQGYVKCLVDVAKETRERAKKEDLSDLSDEDLLELVKGLVKDKDEES